MKNKLGKRICGISILGCVLVLSSCLSSYEEMFPKKDFPSINIPKDGTLVTLPNGNIRFSCTLFKFRDDDGRNEGRRAFTFIRPNMNSLYYKFFCGTQTTPPNLWQKREIDLAALAPSCTGDSMTWNIKNFEQLESQDENTAIFPENQKLDRVIITIYCKK